MREDAWSARPALGTMGLQSQWLLAFGHEEVPQHVKGVAVGVHSHHLSVLPEHLEEARVIQAHDGNLRSLGASKTHLLATGNAGERAVTGACRKQKTGPEVPCPHPGPELPTLPLQALPLQQPQLPPRRWGCPCAPCLHSPIPPLRGNSRNVGVSPGLFLGTRGERGLMEKEISSPRMRPGGTGHKGASLGVFFCELPKLPAP